MKQLSAILLLIAISLSGYAQSDSLSQAISRITNLESKVQAQSDQLAKLNSDLQEVQSQNLALKKNLNLKPTIAKSKIRDKVEYRIIEVLGDKSTGDVHVVMTADNVGDSDEVVIYKRDNEIIDELGNGYNDKERYIMKIKGVADNLYFQHINHHVNTPYTINLDIKKYNRDAQYIKYLSLELGKESGLGTDHAVFENLPIKWVDELPD